MRRRTIQWLTVSSALTLLIGVPSAHATYPGRDGQIALAKQDRYMNYELWSVDPRTRRTRRLTRTPRACRNRMDTWVDEQPSYSPSGRWLVYHHFDDCAPSIPDGIYKVRADGTRRRLLLRPRGATVLDWPAISPSGRLLAWGTLAGDERNPINTVHLAPLAQLAKRVTLAGFQTVDPAWSPGGRLLASSFNVITEFDMTGKELAMLAPGEGMDGSPDFSPDGRRVAFHRFFGGEEGEDIYVTNADGTASTRLTRGRDAEGPTWSPDGRRIAFVRDGNFDGVGAVYVKRLPRGKPRLLLRGVDSERLSWQPRR